MLSRAKTKVLWSLLPLGTLAMLMIVTGWRVESLPVMVLVYLLPAIVMILHAVWTLGAIRAGVLLGLAALTGWYFETLGLQGGTFFGGEYSYGMNMLTIGEVPLAVVMYWAIFVYIGYAVTTSFLYWNGYPKPTRILPVVVLVLMDGVIVTALDLFMDPIMVKQGAWEWLVRGDYFGVPLGNFIGWFTITIIVTGIFRFWEYLQPGPKLQLERSVFLIPVLSYLTGGIAFLVTAWRLEMGNFVWIGGMLMFTVIALNLVMYGRYRLRLPVALVQSNV